MAPANTGNDRIKRMAVIIIDQINNGFFKRSWFGLFILFKVVVKFNEAIIELTPAKCKEKIVKSTAGDDIG
jgi:hypothetical protein